MTPDDQRPTEPDATPRTRYTENATGLEVELAHCFQWGVHPPQFFVVHYPDGQTFITPLEMVNRHFTIVAPQEVFLRSWGGNISRPNKKQRKLDEEIAEAIAKEAEELELAKKAAE